MLSLNSTSPCKPKPACRPSSLPGALVAVVLICSFFISELRAAEPELPEYKLKAGFLYNFAKFVTWPANAFATPQMPITIGVLGVDPFGPVLPRILQSKTVNGRPLEIQYFSRVEDLKHCHVLFISRSEKDRYPAILASIQGRSLLTVSEIERFAHNGGMINLVVVQESVRFEINLQAAERAGLQVSSKLWGLGTLVKGGPAKPEK